MSTIHTATPEQALAAVLSEVAQFLGWPVGHAYIRRSDGAMESRGIWYLPDSERFAELKRVTEATRFAPGEGLAGRVTRARRPVWIPDLSREVDLPRVRLASELGVRSAFAFPVIVRNEVAAVLEFFTESETEPDDDVLALMASIGLHVGSVVERLEREVAVQASADHFRALADNAAEAIVTIGLDDRIHYANPATSRLFGYDPQELLTMSFSQLMPEEFRARHRAGMKRYAATGERNIPWNGIELPGLHRDGHQVPLEVTFGEFVRDNRRFFNGIMRDITERRRGEEERVHLLEMERTARAAAEEARGEAERRARQEAALRKAAAAVSSAFTVDETAKQIAQSALDATHSDGAFVEQVDAVSGELVVIAVAGGAVPPVGMRSPYANSITALVIERREVIVVRLPEQSDAGMSAALAGTCDACSAAVIPLLDAGEPVGSLTLLRKAVHDEFRPDELARALTFGELAALAFRKIHLLEESERKRDELEQVMESRARLIRGFSHDVKNPVGAADGLLALLSDGVMGALAPNQIESVERARRSLGSALGLIDDLLDLSRAEAGQLEIRTAATDVREAARELADAYQAQAQATGLSLSVELPDEFPIIASDPARVRQIIGNLVSNAVKYTPPGGSIVLSAARVAVRTGVRNKVSGMGWIVTSVADTGPGIPADQREVLFREFTRLDPSAGTGAGIGLAISRRLARALGGDITLESEEGRGARFSLWLPEEVLGGKADPG